MTIWDELIIADYESKWLDPDYDFANRCYRADEEAAETGTREMPLTEDEEYEEDLRMTEMRREILRRRYA